MNRKLWAEEVAFALEYPKVYGSRKLIAAMLGVDCAHMSRAIRVAKRDGFASYPPRPRMN